ncbi:MAG: DNA recombination protein RmuC [Candidatus Halichondribacter symbioticus]
MDYLFFSIGLIVALVAGFILARKLAPKAGADTGADADKITLEANNDLLTTQLNTAHETTEKLRNDLSLAQQENATLHAEKTHAETQLVEHKNNVAQMGVQFENVANKILEEKNKKFNEQSQKDITNLLTPFKNNFEKLEATVKESFRNHSSQQSVLQKEIENVVKLHQEMTVETKDLTSALRGDSKTQGDWGEMVLEKMLEDTGLPKGSHYTLQGKGLGLKESETGKSQRPDVVIHLPDNKHLIIDSKVSLTHYVDYCAEEDEDKKSQFLKLFLQSVKKHVADLHDRKYEHIDKLGSPEFTFMFMPIEGAYALALQRDNKLHSYAWDKKVAIVCPSTLFVTLKTVSSVWRLQLQNDKAAEIARQGGNLYDKVVGFAENMIAIGNHLDRAKKNHEGAVNKLSGPHGSILSRTEKLKALGAKATKSMPAELVRDENGADELPAPTPDPEH